MSVTGMKIFTSACQHTPLGCKLMTILSGLSGPFEFELRFLE